MLLEKESITSIRASFQKQIFHQLYINQVVIGVGASIGHGTIIMPLANVGPNSTIGDFCILNTSSTIDHDCYMRDFFSLAPRVVCGGTVTIGMRSAISIGATVKHDICVGDDVVIGANSYVNKSVKNNVVAYGTPCKNIIDRNKGDLYLG